MGANVMKSMDVNCPHCGGATFEARVMKDEGLGAARCIACDRHFLMLDSGDYWFDVIQRGYPRAARCSCKGEAFALHFDYAIRDDGDIEGVAVRGRCVACGRERRFFTADIDYGDTAHLITTPLSDCENPKILYDLHDLSLYATYEDIARVVDFLGVDEALSFVGCVRESGRWVAHSMNTKEARKLVLAQDVRHQATSYMWLFASADPIAVPEQIAGSSRDEDTYWKRSEIVRISPPTSCGFDGQMVLLFYIKFSNERVDRQRVAPKSPAFRGLTERLLAWLKTQFVSWRGPDTFDNPDEHQRAFGNEFRKRRSPRGR